MLENTNEPEVTYVGNYRGQTRAESKFVIIVAVASIVLSFVFFRHFISPNLVVYSPMSDTTATMRLCIVEYSVNKAFFFQSLQQICLSILKTVVIGCHRTKVVYLTNTS